MPKQYDNRGTGALFRNKRKTSDKHPAYTGTFTDAEGREYWLSAWLKKSKAGETFMSLSVRPKDEQQQAQGRGESYYDEAPEDDSVPF